MTHRVFVYGSLKKGFGLHGALEDSSKLLDAATEPVYTMVSLGGYPGVVQKGDTSIKGEVYEVEEDVLRTLDRIEGHPTFYKREEVEIEDIGDCWIYLLPESYLTTRDVIKSGEW